MKAQEASGSIGQMFQKSKLKEDPTEFQNKMILSLLRDGLSMDFVNGSFFADFLAPRFPQFNAIETPTSLRSKIAVAFSPEAQSLILMLKKCGIFWLGCDSVLIR